MTGKDASPEVLALTRHAAAHTLAEAAEAAYEFCPDVQGTFGPTIEDGIHPDFACDGGMTREASDRSEARASRCRLAAEPPSPDASGWQPSP